MLMLSQKPRLMLSMDMVLGTALILWDMAMDILATLPLADALYGYGLGHRTYSLGHGYGHLGYSSLGYGHGYGKRAAEAEPKAKADALYGYGLGHSVYSLGHGYGHLGYGHGYGIGYGTYGYGKRAAEAEADAL